MKASLVQCQASDILTSVMFVDNPNLFRTNNDIKTLFVNKSFKLKKISEWFRVNELSLSTGKTTLTYFHRIQDRDS